MYNNISAGGRLVRFRVSFFVILVGVFVAGLSQPLYATGVQDRHELILLNTNDHHGAILPSEEQGGLAQQAALVKAVRAIHPNVLLLDAGDINTGSALSNMFDAEPDILAYNLMGYNAATFGIHEFDGGLQKLERQMEIANFPFVSANVKTENGDYVGHSAYIVKDYSGFSVGIFGLTTRLAQGTVKTSPAVVFEDEIEAARKTVDTLKNFEKVDIVIALVHLGTQKTAPDQVTSIELAQAVPGINIIVDGFTHDYIEQPIYTGHTYIVTANKLSRFIGQGRIVIKGGKLDSFDWQPIPVGPDPEIEEMLAFYTSHAREQFREELGTAADNFDYGNHLPRYGETPLGNLIADAVMWQLKEAASLDVDFAFFTAGIFRDGFPKGSITYDSIFSALPIENHLYVVTLNGEQLLELFAAFEEIRPGVAAFPVFSKEVRFTLDYSGASPRYSDLTISGEPVDPARTYYFCVNSAQLAGADGYDVLLMAREQVKISLPLSEILASYIRAKGEIIPETDGRLILKGVD
ncbi:MAG: 5'-nucleotidase C-terminal domain-containing protein [Spirochaetaceae bacterium]|jgi:5'-nucleotidase/UDP-sugar diphosphatase|nr:5'-nucleotidase C-terminal domain-containing protein [Spirochaetaceae bacterium]